MAVPIAFSLIFLTINLVIQMYNNITSLERMSFKQFKMPCCGPVKMHEGIPVTPNEFDMLWIANFK